MRFLLSILLLTSSALGQVSSGIPFAAPISVAAQPSPSSTTILTALNNARNAAVHIALLGDSYTVACKALGGTNPVGPTNCANRWPEQIRVALQAAYGSHGTGVYPVIVSTGPIINNQAWSCTGTTSTSNILGPTQSGTGAGNTLVTLSPGATCTFKDNRNIVWDTLNTYCGTNSTSVGLAVSIDSGAFTGTACGSTTGSATAHVVTLAATPSATHSVSFSNTSGSGTAYLYAAEGQSGTTGVSLDNMGLGGASSNAFGSAVTTQLAFSDIIPGGQQAFLLMDQTNDAVLTIAPSTFATNLGNIIAHEQALSSAPSIILAIPPVSVVNNTTAMAPYTAVQTNLCIIDGLTCANIQSRGTTVGSTAVGWGLTFPGCPNVLWDCAGSLWPTGAGGLHPNDAGNLDEAQQIYAELVNPTVVGGGGSMVLLSDQVLSAAAATVTFASIPGTYKHLRLYYNAACSGGAASDALYMQANGDTGNNYYTELNIVSNGAVTGTASPGVNKASVQTIPCGGALSGSAGSGYIDIPSYSKTTFFKQAVAEGTAGATASLSATYQNSIHTGWTWTNTAAITQIVLGVFAGTNFIVGSEFTLYGIN